MRMKTGFAVIAAVCLLPHTAGSASAAVIVLAHSGQTAPGSDSIFSPYNIPNGNYYTFGRPALNSRGQIAFLSYISMAGGDTDPGIFRADSEEGKLVAQKHLGLPSWDGKFDDFYVPAINDAGQLCFWAKSDNGQTGIYVGTGDAWPTQVVREDEPAPLGNGLFSEMSKFNLPALDRMGNIAIRTPFKETSGGSVDNSGIVLTLGSVPQNVARESAVVELKSGQDNVAMSDFGQVAFWARVSGLGGTPLAGIYCGQGANQLLVQEGMVPSGANGEFLSFSQQPTIYQGDLSAAPKVAFHAFLKNTTGVDDDSGLWTVKVASDPFLIIPHDIAHRADPPPDGNGLYDSFSEEVSLDGFWAAFLAHMRDTSNPSLDTDGIYRNFDYGPVNETIKIARGGETAPDGNGVLHQLEQPVVNYGGQVAFQATLSGTTGGSTDDEAIYIGDGMLLVEVARKGDSLQGSTISDLYFATGPDSRNGFNKHAQVAFKATLTNGRQVLALATPLVQWVGGNVGNWSETANWTLGIEPAEVHDVIIAPDLGVSATGPRSDTTVKSLVIGSDAGAQSTLNLLVGGDVTVVETCGILPSGAVVIGDGRTLAAAQITNESSMSFQPGTVNVSGEVNNGTGGSIVVHTGSLAWMHDHLYNQGAVDVEAGAEIHLAGLTGNGCSGGGTVLLGGEVRPGNGIGLMNFGGDVSFDVDSTTYIEFGPCGAVPPFDQIVVEGDLMLDGMLMLEAPCDPAWITLGQRFEIIDVMGTARGRFLGLDQDDRVGILGGLPLHIDYMGGDGNDVELYAVPEPSIMTLLATAVLGLLLCGWRRRR